MGDAPMTDRLKPVEARLGVLETLRRGDWEAIPLDGEAERILIVEVETGTAWIVTVAEAIVEPARTIRACDDSSPSGGSE